jgi:glycosyltransferase involved in cell wall biosynthesis
VFAGGASSLPLETQRKIDTAAGCLRLLFVSHYNYYRNFETLFRALPILKRNPQTQRVKLLLTCQLQSAANPGSYRAEAAGALLRELGISEDVIQLGQIPYKLLHHVYRACDAYVTAAYAETFAHPLVEAMYSAKPVVASDLAVHREICGSAAVYFPAFSPDDLAEQVARLAASPNLAAQMADEGQRRAQDFSWSKHVAQLLSLAESLLKQ